MRILFISRSPTMPLFLGDRLILYHLAHSLAQRGHTFDLLALDDRPDLTSERHATDIPFNHVGYFPSTSRSMVKVLQQTVFGMSRFSKATTSATSPALAEAIVRRVQSTAYDVVHFFGGMQVYEYASFVGSLPKLISPYESYTLYLKREVEAGHGGLMTSLRSYASRTYESFMFDPFKRVVVVSERDREMLQTLNPTTPPDHFVVIPNGVIFNPKPEYTREPASLLFTGNFEYAPNVIAAEHLIKTIFPAVRQQVPHAKLWLVGNAPPPSLLQHADESIIITGRVPDVVPYLEQATIYVSPLTVGAGIKNKILEAMSAGCPVVATPISLDGIAAQDGVHALVAPLEGIASQVVRLLGDTPLRQQLSRDAQALIQTRYSWQHVASAYETLYETVKGL